MIQQASLSDHVPPESSFSDRIALLLAKTDCRVAVSGEQQEAVFRLREEAGIRDQAISQCSSSTYLDRYDNTGHVYLFGLYIDGELASSIRLHIASKEQRQSPSIDVFADLLQPKLDNSQVIVDCTRFVADEYLSQLNRELPYATLRCYMLAAEHFSADYLITAASPAHQVFYRRAFNYKTISETRLDPRAGIPVRLMALNYRTSAHDLYRQYPFYRSTLDERRKLFGHGKFVLRTF
jgi:N-acyl-L-homoserine lactone synthetase